MSQENNNIGLYRGIDKETNNFVYGYYVKTENSHIIIDNNCKIFSSYKKMTFEELKDDIKLSSEEENITNNVQIKRYEVPLIAFNKSYEIKKIPDRFTGTYDKYERPIYENDILEFFTTEYNYDSEVCGVNINVAMIVYDNRHAKFEAIKDNKDNLCYIYDWVTSAEKKIIGDFYQDFFSEQFGEVYKKYNQ